MLKLREPMDAGDLLDARFGAISFGMFGRFTHGLTWREIVALNRLTQRDPPRSRDGHESRHLAVLARGAS